MPYSDSVLCTAGFPSLTVACMALKLGFFICLGAVSVKYLSALLLALTFSWTVFAEEGAPISSPTAYVNLFTAIVSNYGAGNKLKYYKADIALRVKADSVDTVKYHEPLIRDQLIQLFAQQNDEDMNSHVGKEAVRKAALQQVQQVLSQEEGSALVEDLLFNNLVVQP